MRAAIVEEFGPIESHRMGELPDPRPGPGQVIVAVRATAVNFVDLLVVTGKYQFLPPRPFVPGKLPVGVVSEIGSGVAHLKRGDRVLTLAEQGGYAEKVCVEETQCFKLPASMSFIAAAAMALVYDTSWFALRERGRLAPGETVLVLGSTGGVGLASIQLAKAASLGKESGGGLGRIANECNINAGIYLRRSHQRRPKAGWWFGTNVKYE